MPMDPSQDPAANQESTPQPGDQQGSDQGQGMKELITGINTDLLRFKQGLQGVSQIPDDVKGQLDELIAQYQSFVQNLSQAAQGGGQPAPDAAAPAPQGPPQKAGPIPNPGGGKGAVPMGY